MRLHRFYISDKIGLQIVISIYSTDLANQVRRVFRLKKSDRVIVFDGSGQDFECEIIDLEKNRLTLKVLSSAPSRYIPKRDIYLYQALVKKDNFEWIVEKATELGVTQIVPVMAEHSEKKSLNEERLKKIAIEASEQSGRGNVPTIHPIVSLEEALARRGLTSFDGVDFVFHTEGKPFKQSDIDANPVRPRLASSTKADLIRVFIGPEGGWSAKEIEMFHANNMDIVCLGPQVLRSETAVIAALSQVVF